jgi:hypothetical protein
MPVLREVGFYNLETSTNVTNLQHDIKDIFVDFPCECNGLLSHIYLLAVFNISPLHNVYS